MSLRKYQIEAIEAIKKNAKDSGVWTLALPLNHVAPSKARILKNKIKKG